MQSTTMHNAGSPVLVLLAALFWAAGTWADEESSDYIHYRLGVKYRNENRLDQATEEFKRVLAVYPDNYNAYMHLAEIHMGQNKTRLAIFDLKKALAYNPGWGKAHKILSRAYELDGQYEKAIMELQFYQQSCDPAERDSIQQEISYLVKRSQGQAVERRGGAGASASDTSAVDSGKPAAPRRAGAGTRQVKSRSPEVEAAFQKAIELYNRRQLDSATQALRSVIAMQPGHPGAYYYAGLIRRRQGDNDKAKINFEKALEYPELGYNAAFYLGKIYGDQKNFVLAIKYLEDYLNRTSNQAGEQEARNLITVYRAALGDSVRASQIKKDVSLPLDLEMERAVKEVSYTPIEVRIDTLLSLVIVDTLSDAGQRLLSGAREFRAGSFDNAIAEFKKVLVDFPNGAIAAQCAYNIGVCYYKLRLFKEADNQFRQVTERFPGHALAPRASFLGALTYLERKESAQAEKLLRSFIQNNRKHEWLAKAYEKLGDAYQDMEAPGKAVDAYAQALAQAQEVADRVFAAYKLGCAYFDVANPAKGVESFRRAIDLGEKGGVFVRVPDSYYKIADYYYRQKKYKDALALYTRAVRKFGDYQETPWGLFQMGNIHKNLQEYDKAVAAYKELMNKHPDDYWAKQAQWKLEDAVWEHEYEAVLK